MSIDEIKTVTSVADNTAEEWERVTGTDFISKRNIDIASADVVPVHTLVDKASGDITFVGKILAVNPKAATSDPVWQISKALVSGNVTETEYAIDGKFDQIWDNRINLFPYGNQRSTVFDGINDYLNGGDIHKFDIATAFSVSMWVKPQSISNKMELFAKAGVAPAVNGYMIESNGTTGAISLQFRTTTINRSHTFDTALTVGVWQHIVFTYLGLSNISGCSVYRNGVKNTTSPGGSLSGTMLEGQDFTVARRDSALFYSGNIDEIHVFNKALSQAEVDELYNSGSPIDITISSLSADVLSTYRCGDGDTYPIITDKTNTDDLSMINMTSSDFVLDVP